MGKRQVAIINGKKMYVTKYTGTSSAIFSHVDKKNHRQVHVTFGSTGFGSKYVPTTTRGVGAKKAKHGNFEWTGEKVSVRGSQHLADSMAANKRWAKYNTGKAALKRDKAINKDLSQNAPSWFGKTQKTKYTKVKRGTKMPVDNNPNQIKRVEPKFVNNNGQEIHVDVPWEHTASYK